LSNALGLTSFIVSITGMVMVIKRETSALVKSLVITLTPIQPVGDSSEFVYDEFTADAPLTAGPL
jgi:hypothetical protein